jgi:mono/diheme cytochrome c family protein
MSRVASSAAGLVVFVTALALPARFVWAQEPPAPQAEKPAPVVLKPSEIPKEEKERKNPVAVTADSVGAGHKLYGSQCVMCHGPAGDGKGELAVELGWIVPDFTSSKMKERTDGELFYILTQGRDHMPGQGERLRETQKWNLINFIRSLAPRQEKREGTEKKP